MNSSEQAPENLDECTVTRWLPSALLDLPPSEPVAALRTPHRVCVQSLPTSRHAFEALLARTPFELSVELESDEAPLRQVPMREVHEARLVPDLPLDWSQYYWLVDGLQSDLFDLGHDPAAALARGRLRLLVAEETLRGARRGVVIDAENLESAWAQDASLPAPDAERHGEPAQALQQYVRGLTGHLVERSTQRAFVNLAQDLLQVAERRPELGLPPIPAAEAQMLSLYAQHRLFGNPWLTAPAGMVAGWHLLLSMHLLGVWYAGLLLACKRETRLHDALLASLWMLDQGLWRDEALVHDVLRNLNASEYTSPELAAALTTALRAAHVRA